jgi:hypothetical protein
VVATPEKRKVGGSTPPLPAASDLRKDPERIAPGVFLTATAGSFLLNPLVGAILQCAETGDVLVPGHAGGGGGLVREQAPHQTPAEGRTIRHSPHDGRSAYRLAGRKPSLRHVTCRPPAPSLTPGPSLVGEAVPGQGECQDKARLDLSWIVRHPSCMSPLRRLRRAPRPTV